MAAFAPSHRALDSESSAWSAKPTESSSTTCSPTRPPWQDRLADLAQLASASLGTDSREATVAIHDHLDAIENIMRDPQPETTPDIGLWRRSGRQASLSSQTAVSDGSQVTHAVQTVEKGSDDLKTDGEFLPRLQTLLNEVTMFNRELNRRHKESVEIRDLFEERCRGLTRTVAELENEVVELQADLAEDTIELEGIQGTVHGLQDWVYMLQEEQNLAHVSKGVARQKSRRRWGGRKTNDELSPETDAEIVLDGLRAWMRGWKDVEETSQVRAQARKSRRERRQEQLSRPEPGELSQRLSSIGAG